MKSEQLILSPADAEEFASMTPPPRPRFTHDCNDCLFVGRTVFEDIYVCPQGGVMSTLVARWGSDGPAYTSGREVLLDSGARLSVDREDLQMVLDGEGRLQLPSPLDEALISHIQDAARSYPFDSDLTRSIITGRAIDDLREWRDDALIEDVPAGSDVRRRLDEIMDR